MEKKYELVETDFKISVFGVKLFRIKALRKIERFGIAEGDLGGYIEKESNLSRVSGDAWVSGDAQVSGDARVSGDAWVYGNALVYGNAWVYGNARVSGDALVSGDARVYGNARVYGDAQVYGDARVYGNARVYGDAQVSGNALVSPIVLTGFRYNVTVMDSTVTWGCRLFDWDSLNKFKISDCSSEWEYGEFERQKDIVIAICREKWGV